LNFPFYISKRISNAKHESFASTISTVAIVSISIGLGSMILAFFILGGFQETIKNKVYNLKGHLEVTKYTFGNSFDESAITTNSIFYQNKGDYEFIDHVQTFVHKAGMLKTEEEVHGVLFKGVGQYFDRQRFEKNLIAGRFATLPDSGYSREIVISQKIANTLRLSLDDDVIIYFVQNPPRFRKLKIVGIYETGLEEFDDRLIFGDQRLVQRLNRWTPDQVGGFEIFVKEGYDIDQCRDQLFNALDASLYVTSVAQKYVQLFDWLGLLNQNVAIFLGLILIVACFNMVSILLILIMERTYMIGVLLSLGAGRWQIKRIFIYNGMLLISRGLLFGNLFALTIAFIQDKFKIIPLDAANYYMYFVPISWDFTILIYLNILTFVIVSLSLAIPMTVISRIKPVAALRFD